MENPTSRIYVPFSKARMLNPDQKQQVLLTQGTNVGMEEWEIQCFTELLDKKGGSIDKGIALLCEYATYMDEIAGFVRHCNSDLQKLNKDSELHITLAEMFHCMITLTKVVYSLCCWRRLQWIPRSTSSSYSLNEPMTVIFKKEGQRVFSTAKALGVNLFNIWPLDLTVVTLSPVVDLATILSFHSASISGSVDTEDMETAVADIQRLHIKIKELMDLEDRINASEFCDKMFPILRLPYLGITPNGDFSWFTDKVGSLYGFLSTSLSEHAMAKEETTQQIVQCAIDSFPQYVSPPHEKESSSYDVSATGSVEEDSPSISYENSDPNPNSSSSSPYTDESAPESIPTTVTSKECIFTEDLIVASIVSNGVSKDKDTATAVDSLTKDSPISTALIETLKSDVNDNAPNISAVVDSAIDMVTEEAPTTTVPNNDMMEAEVMSSRKVVDNTYNNADTTDEEDDDAEDGSSEEQESPTQTPTREKQGEEMRALEVLEGKGSDAVSAAEGKNIDDTEPASSSRTRALSADEVDHMDKEDDEEERRNTVHEIKAATGDMDNDKTDFIEQQMRVMGVVDQDLSYDNLVDDGSVLIPEDTGESEDELSIPLQNAGPKPQDSFASPSRYDSSSNLVSVRDIMQSVARPENYNRKRPPSIRKDMISKRFLKRMERGDDEGSIISYSANRIRRWWQSEVPMHRLKKRMGVRVMVTDILDDVVDTCLRLCEIKEKRKQKLLRNGAANNIQTLFKGYNTSIKQKKEMQREQLRRMITWNLLNLWSSAVLQGVIIAKFMRRIRSKFKQTITSRHIRHQHTPKVDIIAFQNYFQLLALAMASYSSFVPPMELNLKREALERCRPSAVLIQKYIRRFSVQLMGSRRRQVRISMATISIFMVRYVIRLRRRKKRVFDDAAIVIQKIARGRSVRRKLYYVIKSSLYINLMWRRFISYRYMKTQLRRLDRPYRIILRGLTDLHPKHLSSGQLHVKISVWWNPLLHIVGHSDLSVIIESKKPQYIYTGGYHTVKEMEEAVDSSFETPLAKTRSDSVMYASTNSLEKHRRNRSKRRRSTRSAFASIMPKNAFKYQNKDRIDDFFSVVKKTVETKRAEDFKKRHEERRNVNRGAAVPLHMSPSQMLKHVEEEDDVEESPGENESMNGSNSKSHLRLSQQLDRQSHRRSTARLKGMSRSPKTPPKPSNASQSQEMPSVTKSDSFFKGKLMSALNRGTGVSVNNSDEEATPSNSLTTGSSHRKFKSSRRSSFSRSSSDILKNARKASLTLHNTIKDSFDQILKATTKKKQGRTNKKAKKLRCDFENETIIVPGCHGNSVLKLEVFNGSRKLGHSTLYMATEGTLMYWGGRYCKEVGIAEPTKGILQKAIMAAARPPEDNPAIHFSIIAGPPLRSRCQWGQVLVRGSGPMSKAFTKKNFPMAMIFEKWHRFFFSLDHAGLSLFESKFSSEPFYMLPVSEFKSMKEEPGVPIEKKGTKVMEDLNNVILSTHNDDEVFMRFPDQASRFSWEQMIENVIHWQQQGFIDVKAMRRKQTIVPPPRPISMDISKAHDEDNNSSNSNSIDSDSDSNSESVESGHDSEVSDEDSDEDCEG